MDQHSRLQSITFFAALFLLLAAAGWAVPLKAAEAEGVAMVVALRGQVTAVDQAGEKRPLAVKSPVYVGDTIQTGPSGRLQLMFTDNTIVSLGGNAELEVAAYQWDQRQGELTTRVNQGAFRVMGGSIARTSPENFTTETPAATIGIRGSMYAGRVSNGMLTVVFQGGTGIVVSNPAGRVEITVPGLGTRVRSREEPPAPPARFSGAELEELQEGLPEEEEAAEEAAAEEAAAGEDSEAEPVDEWAGVIGDEPVESATPPVVADDPVVEQVGEVITEAGQEELEQEVIGSAAYSGRGIRVWYSEGSEQVGDFGREDLLLTTKPAILTAIEPELLLENGQSGFSDGDYGEVWWYEDFSYESSGGGGYLRAERPFQHDHGGQSGGVLGLQPMGLYRDRHRFCQGGSAALPWSGNYCQPDAGKRRRHLWRDLRRGR
ncbi:FecR domain-containing protein [Desulfurivibrio sp. D14AmB]|uniref:FecR family protein n=1 Tax=Desulfurivibrio sp. D14AmB TaxID=3374370 RepID=UPI00376F1D5E